MQNKSSAKFGPPARPTLRLRYGLDLEIDEDGAVVVVWNPRVSEIPAAMVLTASIDKFRFEIAEMYTKWLE